MLLKAQGSDNYGRVQTMCLSLMLSWQTWRHCPVSLAHNLINFLTLYCHSKFV